MQSSDSKIVRIGHQARTCFSAGGSIPLEGEYSGWGIAPQLDVHVGKHGISAALLSLGAEDATIRAGALFIAAAVLVTHVGRQILIGIKAGIPR